MTFLENGETQSETTTDECTGDSDSCDWSTVDCDVFLSSLSGLVIARLWREMEVCVFLNKFSSAIMNTTCG